MRMTDIEASLVLSQLSRVQQVTETRNRQANIYHNLLSIENLQFKNLDKDANSCISSLYCYFAEGSR